MQHFARGKPLFKIMKEKNSRSSDAVASLKVHLLTVITLRQQKLRMTIWLYLPVTYLLYFNSKEMVY